RANVLVLSVPPHALVTLGMCPVVQQRHRNLPRSTSATTMRDAVLQLPRLQARRGRTTPRLDLRRIRSAPPLSVPPHCSSGRAVRRIGHWSRLRGTSGDLGRPRAPCCSSRTRSEGVAPLPRLAP